MVYRTRLAQPWRFPGTMQFEEFWRPAMKSTQHALLAMDRAVPRRMPLPDGAATALPCCDSSCRRDVRPAALRLAQHLPARRYRARTPICLPPLMPSNGPPEPTPPRVLPLIAFAAEGPCGWLRQWFHRAQFLAAQTPASMTREPRREFLRS